MKKHKTNHQTDGQPSAKSVRIEFVHATASAISIIGTFNGWRHAATPMKRVDESRWLTELRLPPGEYEYQFLVDGKWVPDPRAGTTAPNPFGEVKSVLQVNGTPNEERPFPRP